jgi:NADH dehydrogenase/NADH:ubiquinone oxidoreductase subunit G
MCLVEITKGTRRKLVAACVYPAEDGLRVTTTTPQLTRIRKLIVELLWPSAGGLAHRLGVERSRFVPELTDCSLCGLCVRYCAEVAKKNVVFFKGRGIDRRIAFVPELADECDSCRGCFKLCTGGFLITEHGRAALERVG